MLSTTYLYDDPDHPGRITGTVQAPEFTSDDWALMVGLVECERLEKEEEEQTRLSPCGYPQEVAYHTDSDGRFKHVSYLCFACTTDPDKPVYHDETKYLPPEPDEPVVPFVRGKTTVTKDDSDQDPDAEEGDPDDD